MFLCLFQVQEWAGRKLDPCDFGWQISPEGFYEAIPGYKSVCPSSVLQELSCKCKANCTDNRCGCRKMKLKCSDLCHCSDECENHQNDVVELIDNDEADDNE